MKKIACATALIIATFIGIIDSTIVNIALPDITAYFQVSLDDASWITTSYVLSMSIFMIISSKFADQFGRKKLMLIGLILFGGSSFICGLATNLPMLIVARFVQGLGGAIITPLTMPMGIAALGKNKIPKFAGLVGAVSGLAAAGGPPIGGVLVDYFNWQSIFLVNVPFIAIAFILIASCADESYDQTVSKKIDYWGMLTLTITLASFTFALLKGNTYGWSSLIILSLLFLSVLNLFLFIWVEKRSTFPMVELSLFKEKTFSASCFTYLLSGFSIICTSLIFNNYLQSILHYKTLEAAFIIMFSSISVIFFMPLGNFLTAKFDARLVNFLGILLFGIGILCLTTVSAMTSKSLMVLYMVVIGAGLGFTLQCIMSSIQHLPEEKSGIGSGLVNAARQIGTCLGIAILISLLTTNLTTASKNIATFSNEKMMSLALPQEVQQTLLEKSKEIEQEKNKELQEKLKKELQVNLESQMQEPAIGQEDFEKTTAIIVAMDEIKDYQTTTIDTAFHHVFRFTGILLCCLSPIGLLTDKKKSTSLS
ncbi:MFS transporter [Isobaculum melis]|uniref:Drug resistance transporter, EmrB/QacA subfamily n=1 Tax=Isobaculum melis TaxID=142588 RepID=A0A1H9QRW8_9LACT|nr:MFS transporter [Isobaculum melis]SER63198.1 drug resistance transporter, EmrB/QacA subfamily [Isobaculum melis]